MLDVLCASRRRRLCESRHSVSVHLNTFDLVQTILIHVALHVSTCVYMCLHVSTCVSLSTVDYSKHQLYLGVT